MSIDASAVARVVGIDTQFKDLRAGATQFLPQHIAIIGQGSTAAAGYPLTPYRVTSAQQAGLRYGFGSPIHLAARECYPASGGGVESIPVTVFPLEPDAMGLAGVGHILPSGTAPAAATYWVRVAGVLSAPFTVEAGDTVAVINGKIIAAINAVLEMPCGAGQDSPGGDVDLITKWKGTSSDDYTVEVLDVTGEVPAAGLTFTISQPTGGFTDPDVAPALAMLGPTWITLVINALSPGNSIALDKIAVAGEGRWGQLVRRPFVCFTGNREPVVATATTTTAARPSDRVNCQLVAPGSVQLPVQIAAAQVREIAKVANDNPPTDYGGRAVRGLIPGTDALQWDFARRDLAVKAGSSTIEIKDGLVRISDVVTMYRPTGEVPPAYRYVVDIMKLMTIIYNVDLEFSKPEWNGAPLIPDGQPTANPRARKPSAAKAALCAIIDSLALQAILSEPEMSKKNTLASINSQNPKRLDLQTTVKLSGNTNIISMDLYFGFYFGQPTLVG